MRSALFAVAYWVLNVVYGLMAAILALVPGRGALTWALRRYCRRMVQGMGLFAGIKVQVKGREKLPQGAFILAAKHHSWGCLLYTSPSPRDRTRSRMPSSA